MCSASGGRPVEGLNSRTVRLAWIQRNIRTLHQSRFGLFSEVWIICRLSGSAEGAEKSAKRETNERFLFHDRNGGDGLKKRGCSQQSMRCARKSSSVFSVPIKWAETT